MPEVEIEGIGTVVFPEDMSLADIQQESARLYDNHSTYATGVQPSALVSRQAQEMMPPSIRETMNRGAQAPLQQQITQDAQRGLGPVYERNRLQGESQAAAKTGARWETVEKVADWADFITSPLRPFASTAENPLGGFASAARPVGQVLNELGDEAVNIYKGVAGSYGLQTGSVDRDVVKALPGIAAAMTGAGTFARLGLAESLAAPVAFGGVPFAQTLAATDDTFAAVKAGAVGTLIPGTAEVGRAMAAKTLGSLVERGILGTGATAAGNMGQKAVEALGAQGAIQVFMEGMNLPEYVMMAPEDRKAALLHNLAVNSAFLMMDVPGVFGRSTSRTRQGRSETVWEAKKTGMKPAAKVGELLESLVNDPEFTARLTRLADEFALEQMNPRNAQLQAQAPEIANVEPRFIDPTQRPFEGRETPLDALEPEPTDVVVRAEEFQQRPAQTIEAPTSPPAPAEVRPPRPAPETRIADIDQNAWQWLAEDVADNLDSFHPGRDGARDYDLVDAAQSYFDSARADSKEQTPWEAWIAFKESYQGPAVHLRKIQSALLDMGLKIQKPKAAKKESPATSSPQLSTAAERPAQTIEAPTSPPASAHEEKLAYKRKIDDEHAKLVIEERDDVEHFGADSPEAKESSKRLRDFEIDNASWTGAGQRGLAESGDTSGLLDVPTGTGAKGKQPVAIKLTPEEAEALRITKLKGAENRGDGIFFIPEKLMTPERRKAVQRGGRNVEVKDWADVTGNPSDRGYAILDRTARNAARGSAPAEAPAAAAAKVDYSTAAGQKVMAARASRIGMLLTMNEAIRKIDPKEAYDRKMLEGTPDSQIDAMQESLRQDWNRLNPKAVEAPAKAAAKVQEHVAEVAAGEKTATPEPALQHTTGPRAAKEIKSELVQRIEEAMAKAPELNEKQRIALEDGPVLVKEKDYVAKDPTKDKREGQIDAVKWVAAENAKRREAYNAAIEAAGVKRVTIEIPGDGTFKVWNTKEALGEMLKRANRLATGGGGKGYSETVPTKVQGQMWMRDASVNPADAYYVHAGGDNFVKTEGKPIRLEEYAPGEFFVHRPIEKGATGWSVSEARSGMRIGSGTTEKAAIAKAREALLKFGPEQVEASIKSAKPSPRAQKAEASDTIDTGALGKVGMGGAKPTEFTAGAGTPTSIKNATVDAERSKRGLPPAMEAGRRTWGEVWERAMAIIDQDPAAQNVLIAQLKAQPRALTDIEDALLLHRQIDLQNQYGRQTRELATAYDDAKNFPGRLEAVERFKVMVQETSKDLFELYEVGKAAGTETGRGLAARKMLADEHFELAQMEMEAREAREGAPLTDAERAELTQAHDTIQRLQAEFAAAEARHEAAAAERRAAEATEDLKQAAKADPDYNPVVIKWAERIVDKLERTGKEAEARWKQMMARTSTGVDPTLLAEAIKIGAGKIARKAMPFAEWAQTMVDAVGESIRPYLQPAWAKLGERIDKVATDIAGRKKAEALKKVRVVDEDARRERLIGSITEAAGEDRPLDEIGTYVRRLALQFVKDGISDRNRLVDAVHSVLVNHFDPDITRREAMDAISGYGDFKPLDPEPAKRTLRDLKGQLQSVAKLEDIVGRRPLLKTGVERRAPSDEERRLIQQVNEAKRVHGVVTTDPARQLKGAQDAMLTRLKHQIADLNFQIDAGARTVKGGSKVASTPEMDGLRHARNELRKRLDELLPRPGISEAQRIATAERGLAADIELYEFKIAARETGPLREKSARLNSAKLDQLRARRDVLKAELAEMRAAASPKLSPEERANRTLNRRIATEYAKVMDRIARSDYAPRRRREVPPMDAATAAAKGRLDQAKTDWRRGLVAEQRRNRSLAAKGWDAAKEVAHAQRQIWTSIDLSAVLRQGGLVVAGHPIRGLKSTPAMLRALSETQSNAEWARVQARPNWSRYQRAKLYLSDPHETTITKLEEEVRSRWLQKVPGIKQSNQTYATFLNKLRADSFDAMVSAHERKGRSLTDAELGGIANYINIATGRGDFGKLAGAADTLAIGFFSPRLLLSRFQYIMGQPLYKAGSWRVRRQIAAEYARTLAGFAAVLALGVIAGAEIEEDPTSSDFLKMKFGNTRVDFGAGILQPLVYLARTIRGEKKTPDGKLVPIRGAVPFGGDDWADVTLNFGRSKFSPAMGTTWDLISGKNVVGEKVTLGSAAELFFIPLSFREVGKTMQDQGVPAGTVIRVLGLLGAGVDTHDSDEKSRKVVGALMKEIRGGTPEQREAIRRRLMEALKK